MKVAIDISPLKSDHRVRGVGSYTKELVDALSSYKDIELVTFDDSAKKPDADIIHFPYFDIFFHTFRPDRKQKTVVTVHDVIPLVFPSHFPSGIHGRINLQLQKRSLSSAEAVICDSKTSKVDISQKLDYFADKIHVVYLAPSKAFRKITDQKKLEATSKKLKLPKKFVLYVGDVNWNKNIKNLLRSIKLSGANLVLVGKAVTDRQLTETQEIDSLAKSLGIENRITKTGYLSADDLCSVYNLADLTLQPSYYEGFGLPALESMACGTSVVCSNNSSLSEITENAAAFCDPNDPEDIAKKIRTVMSMKAQGLDELSKKLIAQASKFTWQKTAKETIAVYNQVFQAK